MYVCVFACSFVWITDIRKNSILPNQVCNCIQKCWYRMRGNLPSNVGANELHHHIQLNKLFHWHRMAKGNVFPIRMVLRIWTQNCYYFGQSSKKRPWSLNLLQIITFAVILLVYMKYRMTLIVDESFVSLWCVMDLLFSNMHRPRTVLISME